jgi:hypothetical protein
LSFFMNFPLLVIGTSGSDAGSLRNPLRRNCG